MKKKIIQTKFTFCHLDNLYLLIYLYISIISFLFINYPSYLNLIR